MSEPVILIRYLPHSNCKQVAALTGTPDFCEGEGESDIEWELDDGRAVWPGQWIAKRADGTFDIVDHDDWSDYVTANHAVPEVVE